MKHRGSERPENYSEEPAATWGKHREADITQTHAAIEQLASSVEGLRVQMFKMGMYTSPVFYETDRDDTKVRVYGGLLQSDILRLVINKHINNSYAGYKGIFIDDFVIGPDNLVHRPAFEPQDKATRINLSDTMPPIIWPAQSGAWKVYEGSVELEAPSLPLLNEDPWIVKARAVAANELRVFLSQLSQLDRIDKYPQENL